MGYLQFCSMFGIGQFDIGKIDIRGEKIAAIQKKYRLHKDIERELAVDGADAGPAAEAGLMRARLVQFGDWLRKSAPAEIRCLSPNWVPRVWAILLAQVLVFYAPVLFVRSATIPWDFRYYHYPPIATMADAFARGEFPLWTPYIYCGMPLYAMLGAGPLYPPTILAVLLSNLTGGGHLLFFMELQLAAHVFLAGLFTWRLLRTLNLGPAAALTGATIYQLGAYFASQAQHLGAINAAAWMPLAWEAVILLARGFTFRRLALLVAALAMALLAGFPAVTAVVWGATLLLALALGPRAAAYAALGAVWAAALSAVQLLPTLELTGLSVAGRRSQFMGAGGGLPLEALVSLVWPNRWGVFDFDPMTWRLPWNPTFLYLYCGLPALVFAAAALWRRAGARRSSSPRSPPSSRC